MNSIVAFVVSFVSYLASSHGRSPHTRLITANKQVTAIILRGLRALIHKKPKQSLAAALGRPIFPLLFGATLSILSTLQLLVQHP